MKFARQASARPQGTIITRTRSYHGATYAAGALSGDLRTARQMDPAAFHVVHCQPPYAYRCPFGTGSDDACGRAAVQEVERLIREDRRTAWRRCSWRPMPAPTASCPRTTTGLCCGKRPAGRGCSWWPTK